MECLPHKGEDLSSDLLNQCETDMIVCASRALDLLRRGAGQSQESAEVHSPDSLVYAAVNLRPYLKHRLTPEVVLWAPQVGVTRADLKLLGSRDHFGSVSPCTLPHLLHTLWQFISWCVNFSTHTKVG